MLTVTPYLREIASMLISSINLFGWYKVKACEDAYVTIELLKQFPKSTALSNAYHRTSGQSIQRRKSVDGRDLSH